MHQRKHKGFTLLELMITVAVITILATIAYPAYQDYVLRAKRADAKAGLLSLRQAQEKYRANCVQYADGIHSSTRTCVSGGDHDLVHGATSPDGNYNLSISNAGSTTYKLTATATGSQTADSDCKTLSIDQDGTKTSTNSSDADSTSTGNCWSK